MDLILVQFIKKFIESPGGVKIAPRATTGLPTAPKASGEWVAFGDEVVRSRACRPQRNFNTVSPEE